MPQFFSTRSVKARSFSTFLFDFGGIRFAEGFVLEDPRGIEAELDADVAVLVVGAGVEVGAEADDADAGGGELPVERAFGGQDFGFGAAGLFEREDVAGWRVESGFDVVMEAGLVEDGFEGLLVLVGGGGVVFGVVGAWGFGLRLPEEPAHFELVGGVVVELLGGFGDGVFDDGVLDVGGVFGALVVDEDALIDGGLCPVDGVGGSGGDAAELAGGFAFSGDGGELAENARQRRWEGLQAEVGEPEAEVELVGHKSIVVVSG